MYCFDIEYFVLVSYRNYFYVQLTINEPFNVELMFQYYIVKRENCYKNVVI